MKHNVGSYDGAIRAMIGFAILAVGHHERSWWALIGFVPILSGAFAFCAIYWVLGINTCAQDEIDDRHPPLSST